MSGFRVTTDVHHLPGEPREWMLVFNGWQVWKLTDEELRDFSADVLMKLAGRSHDNQLAAEADRIAADDQRRAAEYEAVRDQSIPIDAGHPAMPWLTEAEL